jgi:pimeloyl-ACP methyl ester carboxylesterase
MRALSVGIAAALRRRSVTGLLLVVLSPVLAAGAGCGVFGDSGPSASAGRVETKATNPPPGLPASFTTGQRLDWSDCPESSGARGDGWECATMKAPLDYRRPGRDTIDVALIRKRATGPERKRIGSLLLNFGGPGQSGVVGLPDFADDYESLNERYDLVSFDPRGVRGTAPVRCGKDEFEGAEACRKYSGRVLPYVGTSQTARDLDLMRYLLGDERLHYFGVSYGTALGGIYAHLFPENVGRVVLEAPVDPALNRLEAEISGAKAVQLAFDRFAAHCARTYDDCPLGRDPAQADRRVIELLKRLKKKPAPTGGGEKLDDSLAAHAIGNYLDLGKEGWTPLVEALREVMERGSGGALLDKAYDHGSKSRAAGAAATAGGRVSDSGSTSAFVAITCADSNVRPGFTAAERMIRRITAASPVFGETWSAVVYLCYEWPFEGESATFDVSADGAAPILVVANTGDPTTPYSGAGHMVEELGEGVGVLLTVRAEGHGSYLHIRCAARAIDAYLLDGRTPAATCDG